VAFSSSRLSLLLNSRYLLAAAYENKKKEINKRQPAFTFPPGCVSGHP